MSRNLTYRADNRNETLNAKMNSSMIIGIIINHSDVGVTPFSNAKTNTTIRLNPRLIRADKELERTTKYLGIRILRIKSPLATTDPAPSVVASVKKLHNTTPVNRYTE